MVRWVKADWSKSDLDRKKVEFVDVPLDNYLLSGSGEFCVLENSGSLSIEILFEGRGSTSDERVQKRFHLNQEMANRIVRHPNRQVADFLLK